MAAEANTTTAQPSSARAKLQQAARDQAAGGEETSGPTAAQRSQHEAVARLLRGEGEAAATAPNKPADDRRELPADDGGELPADDGGELPADETEASDEPAELRSVHDLADLAGLSKGQMNKLEVDVNGEAMTLGEMKNEFARLRTIEKNAVDFEETKERHGLEHLDAMRRLAAVIEKFPPGSVPPGVLEAIERDHAHRVTRERALLHTARPEFADANTSQAALKRMAAIGKEYGISDAEVAATVDHRHLLILSDYAALRERVAKAKELAKRKATDPEPMVKGDAPRASPHVTIKRRPQSYELASRVARIIKG